MTAGDNLKDRVLSSLMAYFVLFLLFSLTVSFFIKNEKDKKIIYVFCSFLFISYVFLATIFNFYGYSNKFWREETGDLLMMLILVLLPLLLTLIWWLLTRKRK